MMNDAPNPEGESPRSDIAPIADLFAQQVTLPTLTPGLPQAITLRNPRWPDLAELVAAPRGLADAMAAALAPWQAEMERLREMATSVGRELGRATPPNWPEDHDLQLGRLMELASRSGVPLVWIPRAEVVTELVESTDPHDVLLHRSPDILEDCRQAVLDSDTMALQPAATMVVEAMDSLQDGRAMVAQAGAAVACEILWKTGYQDQDSRHFQTVYESIRKDPAAAPMRFLRGALLTMSGLSSWSTFYADRGDPIPEVFNRHGTVHTLSPLQYKPTNALLGVMLASGLLRETHEINSTRWRPQG